MYRWSGSAWITVRDAGIAAAQADASQAISDAAGAQGTADGKVVTFIQTGQPTAEGTGDLWIDSDDGNKLYRWSGSVWVEIQDDDIATAISNAATAQSTADGKIISFYQDAQPTAEAEGDFWIDTNDDNKLYRWNGSSWLSARDATIAAAQADAATGIADAATAQGTADGKVVTFIQAIAPTAEGVGDLWIDSDDGNNLYRWSGIAWVGIQDGGIATAISDASDAQSTADGKIVSFYAASAPTAEGTGDLWTDTDDNNKLYRWSGSAWVSVRDASSVSLFSDTELAAVVTIGLGGNVQTGTGRHMSLIPEGIVAYTGDEPWGLVGTVPNGGSGYLVGTVANGGSGRTVGKGQLFRMNNTGSAYPFEVVSAQPSVGDIKLVDRIADPTTGEISVIALVNGVYRKCTSTLPDWEDLC